MLSRRVLGPRELEARDANLVGGAINGGTSQLHQELVLRPVPGLGRAETPVKGLYLASASAHPGGGVHGAPGLERRAGGDRARSATPRQPWIRSASRVVDVDDEGTVIGDRQLHHVATARRRDTIAQDVVDLHQRAVRGERGTRRERSHPGDPGQAARGPMFRSPSSRERVRGGDRARTSTAVAVARSTGAGTTDEWQRRRPALVGVFDLADDGDPRLVADPPRNHATGGVVRNSDGSGRQT